MKLDQLYYTSCRRGLSSGPGFQTRAMSAGLSTEDRREIEIKGGYRLPRDIDIAAMASLADERLPVAYRVYRLRTGRFALTRSACAGQDYTGRGGNFFAHTVVFEGEPPTGVWPASFLNWPTWLPRLAPEEDGLEPPPPLPILALVDAPPEGALTPGELSAFLRQRAEVGLHFPEMLAALFHSRKDNRLLLVRDTPGNNVLWLACLQMALPSAAAWRLSWSSYQDDPRGAGQISATCGETGYRLDRNARDFQYYLFDFTAGQFSAVAEGGEYARRLAGWLLDEPATLDEFHSFANLFAADKLLDRLPEVLMLFRMARGEGGGDAEHWRQAAELARECLNPGARDGIVAQFLCQAQKVSDEAITPWFAFYVELATGSSAPLGVLELGFLRRLLPRGEPAELGRQMARLAGGNVGHLLAMAERTQAAYYDTGSAERAGASLRRFGAGFLEKMPLSLDGLAIRGKLESIGCYDVLLGEWDERLKVGGHPPELWRKYRTEVLKHLPSFATEYGALMAESAWKASRSGNGGEVALEWCELDDLALLPPATRGEILLAAYQGLPFDFGDEPDQTEARILALAKRWELALPDHRAKLRALRRIPRTGVTPQEVAGYALALRALPSRQYLSFLADYFPALFLARPRSDPEALFAGLSAALDTAREAQWCEVLGKSLEYLGSRQQEDGFGRWFLKCWLGSLAKSLRPEARLALLSQVAGLYLDDAEYKLLAEREPGKYRDELLKECDMARLRHTSSRGGRVQGAVSAFLKVIGMGKPEKGSAGERDLPADRSGRGYRQGAADVEDAMGSREKGRKR